MKRFLLKRWLFVVPGVVAYLVALYAQGHPDWTEQVFSQSIYPSLSSIVGFLPSLVGFSVAEWFVLLFILFCLAYIVYYIRKIILHKKDLKPSKDDSASKDGRTMIAYRGMVGILAIMSVMYFVFTITCGLNYYRYSFSEYTGYEVKQSSEEELEQLCISLVNDLNQTREELGEHSDLSASTPGDFSYYSQHSVEMMQLLAKQYSVLEKPLYSAPKPVLASGLMSDAGIGGVFFPFTMESNINAEMPFFSIPSTMAHELAHQCGFMREDEANFIAYLACRESDEALMRYSGQLLAFNHSISALWATNPEKASEVLSGLSSAVQSDRSQSAKFWSEHEGTITDISRSTNDAYLKANNQEDGISSYGRMVDLLLAEQRASAK